MSDKKPAHEVAVEMVRETVEAISKDEDIDGLKIVSQIGILSAEFEMLKRMIIPEKHQEEVVKSLRQIKENWSLENVDTLFPESIFLEIAPSAKDTKKDEDTGFTNPTGHWKYGGTYSVELTEDAHIDGLPVSVIIDGEAIVTVYYGKIWQGVGKIQFYTSEEKPFHWGYKAIEAIRGADGTFIWINRDGKYASELKQ